MSQKSGITPLQEHILINLYVGADDADGNTADQAHRNMELGAYFKAGVTMPSLAEVYMQLKEMEKAEIVSEVRKGYFQITAKGHQAMLKIE
jgi:hypothetical protein